MEPKFKVGDPVLMFGYFKGVVRDYNPQEPAFYTVYCGQCLGLHQVWEIDLRLVEKEKEHESARD